LKTLIATVRRQRLFREGETVVVAVSGGADSVALLDILARLDLECLKLVVAHLNHCLRGEASDGDEAFVAGLAAGYGLPFASKRVDVAALAKASKLSLEDAGRQARYSFFAQTAEIHGATSIAVAHHLDDQAETVLMRLLRGAGGAGLSGMASIKGLLKRPLLQVCRADIERYLRARGITFRTDATNADPAILRNSIRHELLPRLRSYNPNISQRLAATAEILASDQELLEELTDAAFLRLAEPGPDGVVLRAEGLCEEKRGLRLRLYRRALSELRGDLRRIGLTHLEAIDALLLSPRPNASLNLPAGCLVKRSYGALLFRKCGVLEPAWEIAIDGAGGYDLPSGRRLQVRQIPRPSELDPGGASVAFLDPERAPFPWRVRSFLPGDRLAPLGMKGVKKVKDVFINGKVPLAERRLAPVIVSGDRIVCIVGVKMGDYAKVSAETGSVVRVEILDITP
jgi:tRNA(Ile)-lysidine synthase